MMKKVRGDKEIEEVKKEEIQYSSQIRSKVSRENESSDGPGSVELF